MPPAKPSSVQNDTSSTGSETTAYLGMLPGANPCFFPPLDHRSQQRSRENRWGTHQHSRPTRSTYVSRPNAVSISPAPASERHGHPAQINAQRSSSRSASADECAACAARFHQRHLSPLSGELLHNFHDRSFVSCSTVRPASPAQPGRPRRLVAHEAGSAPDAKSSAIGTASGTIKSNTELTCYADKVGCGRPTFPSPSRVSNISPRTAVSSGVDPVQL